MYSFYLDRTLLPVAPSRFRVRINNQNRTFSMIDGGEVNLLKAPGLTHITLNVLLPNVPYSFANYRNGFQTAEFFLKVFDRLKTRRNETGNLIPFQLVVSRSFPDGRGLFGTNMTVSLEDYQISEEAGNGFDVSVELRLKMYRPAGTKVVQIRQTPANNVSASSTANRETANAPSGRRHTVVRGDNLYTLARRFLGSGARRVQIYNLNRDVIEAAARRHGRASSSNGHWIFPGTVLQIP